MSEFLAWLDRATSLWWSGMLHGTWQAAVVAVAALWVVSRTRRWASTVQYGILLIALAKFAMPPFSALPVGAFSQLGPRVIEPDLSLSLPEGHDSLAMARQFLAAAGSPFRNMVGETTVSHREADSFAAAEPQEQNLSESTARSSTGSSSVPDIFATSAIWVYMLLVAYFAGAAIVAAVAVSRWRALCRIVLGASAAGPSAGGERLLARLKSAQLQVGLSRPVRLLVSECVDSPFACGLFRPTIVVPRSALLLSSKDLDVALVHELLHIRRLDLWVNWLQMALCVAWWFHPLVWLITRELRRVRENCCDDALLRFRVCTPTEYCDALLSVARRLNHRNDPELACSMVRADHPLNDRVRRILDENVRRPRGLSVMAMSVLLVVALAVLPGVQRTVAFENDLSPAPADQLGNSAVDPLGHNPLALAQAPPAPGPASHDSSRAPAASRQNDDWRLVFTTTRHQGLDAISLDLEGKQEQVLRKGPDASLAPSLSRDGKLLVFASLVKGVRQVLIRNMETGAEQNLSNNAFEEGSPAWSPDGQRIVFTSMSEGNQDIYVMNADGTDRKAVAADSAFDADPAWAPDGKRILFVSVRELGGYNFKIYSAEVDGTGVDLLIEDQLFYGIFPGMSPDGESVAYAARGDTRQLILKICDLKTGVRTELARDEASYSYGRWSPDGRYIAYIRFSLDENHTARPAFDPRDLGGDLLVYDTKTGTHSVVSKGDVSLSAPWPSWARPSR